VQRCPLTFDEREREYYLVAPVAPRAIAMFLHGKGGTADWADRETGWSTLAERERFALVMPEALAPDPSQPPKFLLNPPVWNDGSTGTSQDAEFSDGSAKMPDGSDSTPADRDDVGFLSAVLDDASRRLGFDRPKVFVAGFSNGAGMAFRFAAERADRIGAIAPIAGHCWVQDPRPARPVPTLYVVGTADPLIPLRGGEVRSPWLHRLIHRPPVSATLERWAEAIGCSQIPELESERGNVRTDIYPGPVTFRSLSIEGLGHHWPGGKGQLNPRLAGAPSNEVDATELIWRFFEEFV
jgi:polyhydroxybutyrate depolymerase